MQFDLDSVREVFVLGIHKHMATRHQKQTGVSLKKESAGIRKLALPRERENVGRSQQDGLDHRFVELLPDARG